MFHIFGIYTFVTIFEEWPLLLQNFHKCPEKEIMLCFHFGHLSCVMGPYFDITAPYPLEF